MTITSSSDIYYDPFDIEIDKDPHPLWKRMRDEAPLYRNEKYAFFALSRYDDVEQGLVDWDNFRSGKGSTLEMILSGVEMPPGSILMEDPPSHDIHRSLMSRVFTPKSMLAIEPKVREFCNRTLDPLVAEGRFDFIADLGAIMPMLTIGMLLGIPEEDQVAIRDRIDASLRIDEDRDPDAVPNAGIVFEGLDVFGEYIDHRTKHPSDDLMTKLIQAEFEDEHGVTRTLTRDETMMYIMLLAGAGNETTTRLIGWTGKLLSEHPDQRHELAADRSLVPQAIEEILRYEAPSPVQARTVIARRRVLRGDRAGRQHHGAAQRLREPRRAALPRRRSLRHPPHDRPPPELRLRPALLPRRRAGAARGARRARRGPEALERLGRRLGQRQAGPHPQRARLGTAPRHRQLSAAPHMDPLFDLDGRRALVTGGGQNLGEGIARTLGRIGAHVVINDLVEEHAQAVADEIVAGGGAASIALFDVTDFDAVMAGIDAVGPIDILVNNAGNAGAVGWAGDGPFVGTTPADWDAFSRVNLYGVMHCVRTVTPSMIERQWGRIVTIISDAARVGESNMAAYAAAKAGAAGFTPRTPVRSAATTSPPTTSPSAPCTGRPATPGKRTRSRRSA